MIGRITQVIGTMPDVSYLVSVTSNDAYGEVPAAPIYRPPADRYKVAPFEVGDAVALELYNPNGEQGIVYIATPEPLDVEDCG